MGNVYKNLSLLWALSVQERDSVGGVDYARTVREVWDDRPCTTHRGADRGEGAYIEFREVR
jgi:hypothetical protein